MNALGLMEFFGYLHAVAGLDTALKAANVRLASCTRDGGGLVSLLVTGDVAAVRAALDAVQAAPAANPLFTSVIARPAAQTATMVESESTAVNPAKVKPVEFVSNITLLPKEYPGGETNGDTNYDKIAMPEEKKDLRTMTVQELRTLALAKAISSMGVKEIKKASKKALIVAIEKEQGR